MQGDAVEVDFEGERAFAILSGPFAEVSWEDEVRLFVFPRLQRLSRERLDNHHHTILSRPSDLSRSLTVFTWFTVANVRVQSISLICSTVVADNTVMYEQFAVHTSRNIARAHHVLAKQFA